LFKINYSQDFLNYNSLPKNSIGINYASTIFYGDIVHINKPSLFINNRPSIGVFYEKNFLSNFSTSLNINWGELSTNNATQNFQSTILHASIENIIYFKKIRSNQNKIIPFISLGLGILVFQSYSDLLDKDGNYYNYWEDGSIRDIPSIDSLSNSANFLSRDYVYETSVSNDSVNFGNLYIPVSIGFLWKFKNIFNAKIFFTYNQLFTDWIDNISNGINDKFISIGLAVSVYFSRDGINYKKDKKQFVNIFENLDSDFDGIKDHNDKCQKTPKNVSILPNGCPVDSDFDGIPDFKDIEPYSKSIILIDDSGRTIKSYQNLNTNLKFDTIINFKIEEF
jgi:hypothetical protein